MFYLCAVKFNWKLLGSFYWFCDYLGRGQVLKTNSKRLFSHFMTSCGSQRVPKFLSWLIIGFWLLTNHSRRQDECCSLRKASSRPERFTTTSLFSLAQLSPAPLNVSAQYSDNWLTKYLFREIVLGLHVAFRPSCEHLLYRLLSWQSTRHTRGADPRTLPWLDHVLAQNTRVFSINNC